MAGMKFGVSSYKRPTGSEPTGDEAGKTKVAELTFSTGKGGRFKTYQPPESTATQFIKTYADTRVGSWI